MSDPGTAGRGLSRRQVVAGAGMALGALAVGGPTLAARRLTRPETAAAAAAGYDHVVVVMLENRSFDHLLGWLPGADGRPQVARARRPNGARCATPHAPPGGRSKCCKAMLPDQYRSGVC
jgi:phospholipase C